MLDRRRMNGLKDHRFTKLSWGVLLLVLAGVVVNGFTLPQSIGPRCTPRGQRTLLFSDWNDPEDNQWDNLDESILDLSQVQNQLKAKQDGSFWSSFASSDDDDDETINNNINGTEDSDMDDDELQADAWLDSLASLRAEEVEFSLKEADRADKVRQMEEWGFDRDTIANTLGVAIDAAAEQEEDMEGMQDYRQDVYDLDPAELADIDSHKSVPKDKETGDPIRQQMVYVDEHACIGCTNCAMVAQSTFFMEEEFGRARVYQQWGDDDETVAVAIETCPVDCIHYVPYDELVKLEVERRDQLINFKSRLVGGDGSLSHRVGGAAQFTAPQQISGNMGARCNNCPSRGCRNCPMFGVGKNPEFERKERIRKAKRAKAKLERERKLNQKSVDL